MTSIIQPPHYELISYTDDGVVIADRATDEQRKEIEEFFKELDGFSMDRTKTKKKSAPKKEKEAVEEANSDS
jgi:5S rRNA maturation endonuclease (ribonuclease M5)